VQLLALHPRQRSFRIAALIVPYLETASTPSGELVLSRMRRLKKKRLKKKRRPPA
jgi:hypothetical protein